MCRVYSLCFWSDGNIVGGFVPPKQNRYAVPYAVPCLLEMFMMLQRKPVFAEIPRCVRVLEVLGEGLQLLYIVCL